MEDPVSVLCTSCGAPAARAKLKSATQVPVHSSVYVHCGQVYVIDPATGKKSSYPLDGEEVQPKV